MPARSAPVKARFAPVKMSSLLVCGVLAGLVVAGFALPAAAVMGLTARYAGESFENLPRDLQTPPSAQTTYIYANDGRTLITGFYEENRTDLQAQEIPEVMRQAIVAAEDVRFYQHNGVDLRGLARAMVVNSTGGEVTQGGSTLTMQYVRNVLKNDKSRSADERAGATEQTAGRKVQEMRYSTAIEEKLSKPEILRRYLNIAYFGAGAYGVYAASQTYFGKAPKDLTLAQAALLAGLVQSPDRYNPIIAKNRPEALGRRTYVLGAMVDLKMISAEQAAAADKEELKLQPRQQPNNCTAVPAKKKDWGFFCDYFLQWWKTQAAFGRTPDERENNLKRGGYRVVTSLDPRTQAAALEQSLSVYGYNSARALPIAAVEPNTGHVRALAVNRHYSVAPNPGKRPYPNTVNQLIAGGPGVNGYQAGSTFKLFTMLAALDTGMPLSTTLTTKSPLVTSFRDTAGPASCGGFYCPRNADPSMDGSRNMWTGFGRSANTYFVRLEEMVGVPKAVAMAQKLGIVFREPSEAEQARNSDDWGSFTLGVTQTTPLDLANAYATIAADGRYCKPLPVLSITDHSGAKLPVGPDCQQVVSPEVARAAVDAARCPVGGRSAFGACDRGTATGVSGIMQGRPIAGKTGSSENYSTETFVGTTPQLAAAGIAANPQKSTDSVGAEVSSQVNRAVAEVLVAGLRDQPVKDFPAPGRAVAFGNG